MFLIREEWMESLVDRYRYLADANYSNAGITPMTDSELLGRLRIIGSEAGLRRQINGLRSEYLVAEHGP